MILILGETAAAREIYKEINSLNMQIIRGESKEHLISLANQAGESIEAIVDASHPSCSSLFASLQEWCEKEEIPYLRLERPETKFPENLLIRAVQSWDEAMLALEDLVRLHSEFGRKPVTVFVTTGSHQLDNLVQRPFAKFARLVVRVLPEGRLVQKCQDLGISSRDIIAMQGPFSKDLNRILLKSYGADILLTRDSGSAGGTDTKISAALALGIQIVLLKRPVPAKVSTERQAHSVKEVLAWVKKMSKKN